MRGHWNMHVRSLAADVDLGLGSKGPPFPPSGTAVIPRIYVKKYVDHHAREIT